MANMPPTYYQPNRRGGTPITPQKSAPGQTPQPQSNQLADMFNQKLSDLPFYNTPAFQNIVNQFASDPNRTIQSEGNANAWKQQFQGWADTFASQFKNLAGRDPTADEYNTFFSQVVNPTQPWNHTADQAQIQQGAQGLLKDTFSSTIADAQRQKAEQQATTATAAGSPFDVWQQGINKSVNNLDSQLQDYQARLFEKIRPQLLTSLQSQGLLNSGALNEAFAGANKDLTDASQSYIANAKLAAGQDIANQKYAIQSAPGNFALQNTFNTIPDLTSSGQNALQNAFGNYMNTNLANIGYQNQLGLMNAYNQNQPSLLSQYGGQILGGATAGLVAHKW